MGPLPKVPHMGIAGPRAEPAADGRFGTSAVPCECRHDARRRKPGGASGRRLRIVAQAALRRASPRCVEPWLELCEERSRTLSLPVI
jgi:hypothetical protein